MKTRKTKEKNQYPKLKRTEEYINMSDIKFYEIISYIFVFWLVGLLVPERDEEELKFHVGQGIILNICQFILLLIINFLNNIYFSGMYVGFNNNIYENTFGTIIITIFITIFIVISVIYSVIGITNVVKGKKKYLPFIGKYSFYK